MTLVLAVVVTATSPGWAQGPEKPVGVEGQIRGGPALVPELVEGLKEPDPRVRTAMARALERLGPVAKDAVEPLLRQARDRNPTVRSASTAALRSILRGQEDELKKLQELNDLIEILETLEDESWTLEQRLRDYSSKFIRGPLREILPPQ
jgi:HEAT repeat protein